MAEKDYLTQDEQFKEILNNEEISRIQDYELREIRSKYWNKLHEAFLDERGIPDSEFGNVWDKIRLEEKKELDEYKKRHNIPLD